jgi:hypothetical protein
LDIRNREKERKKERKKDKQRDTKSPKFKKNEKLRHLK